MESRSIEYLVITKCIFSKNMSYNDRIRYNNKCFWPKSKFIHRAMLPSSTNIFRGERTIGLSMSTIIKSRKHNAHKSKWQLRTKIQISSPVDTANLWRGGGGT